jgi:hypothetical protein
MNYIRNLLVEEKLQSVTKFVVVSRPRKNNREVVQGQTFEIAEQGSFCGSTDRSYLGSSIDFTFPFKGGNIHTNSR